MITVNVTFNKSNGSFMVPLDFNNDQILEATTESIQSGSIDGIEAPSGAISLRGYSVHRSSEVSNLVFVHPSTPFGV